MRRGKPEPLHVLFSPVEAPLSSGEMKQLAQVHVHQKRTVVYTLPRPTVGVSNNKNCSVRGIDCSHCRRKREKRNTMLNVRCTPANHCALPALAG